MTQSTDPLTYANAGVSIEAGNKLVNKIKPLVAKTKRPEVVTDLGGFAGMFALDNTKYQEPLLVSGTDGVGTKLKVAELCNKFDTVGIDLVAMCVNDIITSGAEPLFFLDYYACGKLDVDSAAQVVAGICEGCSQANMALLGGETAEMPGLYHNKDFDLAGFAVGIVERSKVISGKQVTNGDVILGLAANGLHSNGYSLVRRVIADQSLDTTVGDKTLRQWLLQPTEIYVNPIRTLIESCEVKALAHITGGGLVENLSRVIPHQFQADIDWQTIKIPAIFTWLQEIGNLDWQEMRRTFNCGIGMTAIVTPLQAPQAIATLAENNIDAYVIGTINHG